MRAVKIPALTKKRRHIGLKSAPPEKTIFKSILRKWGYGGWQAAPCSRSRL